MQLTASVATLLLVASACYSTTRYRIPGDGNPSREYASACHLECSSRLGAGGEYYQCLSACPGVERAPGESCTGTVRNTSIMCEEQRDLHKGRMIGVASSLLLGVLATAVMVGFSGQGGPDPASR